jgi:hypothetical protein
MKLRIAVLASFVLLAGPASADFLGIDWYGKVWRVNEGGYGTLIGSSGVAQTNSMAFGLGGNYYTASGGNIYRIDPATGAASFVKNLTFAGASDIRGLAILNRDIYALVNTGTGADDLWRINADTWVATRIGWTGRNSMQALTTASTGHLYGWDVSGDGSGGLYRIDPVTAASTDLNPLVDWSQDIQGLTFRPENGYHGAGHSFYNVYDNGSFDVLGAGGYWQLRGVDAPTEFFVPGGMSVYRGTLLSGGADSLRRLDGNALRIDRDAMGRIEFNVTTTAPLSNVSGMFTDQFGRITGTAAGTRIRLSVWDYAESHYTILWEVDGWSVPNGYLFTMRNDALSGPYIQTHYMAAARQMVLKYEVFGPTTAAWGLELDTALFGVNRNGL